jgi:methylated-DNA-[protein]-cysteine S-methyltransferase
MSTIGYALFPTAIGPCAIAWSAHGVTGFWLPESTAAKTLARVRRRHPTVPESSPSPGFQAAIDACCALLRGEKVTLDGIELDLAASGEFQRRVYDLARTIAPGQTMTYGEMARRLGHPGLARAVGQALGANPIPLIVPCHRVLAAGNKPGGFSAPGGSLAKMRLLAIEGATPGGQASLFDAWR